MKVNTVSNTNFESKNQKKKFITDKMRWTIQSILLKMNSDIKQVKEGDYYKSTINTKLKYNKKNAVFLDDRRLREKIPYEDQMQGISSLVIGKKTVLDINNETGEIIDYQKPHYKPFFLVLKNAENILLNIRTNFNLPQVVQKEYVTVNDLASDCFKKKKRFVRIF